MAGCCLFLVLSLPVVGEDLCGLRFIALNHDGTVPAYKVSYFKGPQPKSISSAFEGLRITDIPCGSYSYELERSDVKSDHGHLSGQVVLRDPNQWLTLHTDPNLSIGQGGVIFSDKMPPVRHRLTGRISSLPQDRPPTWARLFKLYGTETRETELSNTGIFEFAEAPDGRYGLLVLQPKGVIKTFWLDIKSSRMDQIVMLNVRDSSEEAVVVPGRWSLY